MSDKRRVLIYLAGLFLLLLTVACDLDTIEEVKADPYQFEKKEARIAGIVRQQYGALGQGVYELEDRTGKIWVYSGGRGVPSQGAKVEVKGHTKTAFSIPGLDLGLVLIENKRKLRD